MTFSILLFKKSDWWYKPTAILSMSTFFVVIDASRLNRHSIENQSNCIDIKIPQKIFFSFFLPGFFFFFFSFHLNALTGGVLLNNNGACCLGYMYRYIHLAKYTQFDGRNIVRTAWWLSSSSSNGVYSCGLFNPPPPPFFTNSKNSLLLFSWAALLFSNPPHIRKGEPPPFCINAQ